MCLKKIRQCFEDFNDYKKYKSEKEYLGEKLQKEMKRKPKQTDAIIQTHDINMDRQKRIKEINNRLDKINIKLLIISEKWKGIKSKVWKFVRPILIGVIIGTILLFLNKLFLKLF